MDVISQLLGEHERIRTQLQGIRVTLGTPGGATSPAAACSALATALRDVDARLAHHAHKEEEALFPVLEQRIGPAGPTQVMRAEHRAIQTRGALLRETLRELTEVDHPRIDAARDLLRRSLAAPAAPDDVRAMVDDLLQLIEVHFMKEERVLFPMAEHLLSPADVEEVGARVRALDDAAAIGESGLASPGPGA